MNWLMGITRVFGVLGVAALFFTFWRANRRRQQLTEIRNATPLMDVTRERAVGLLMSYLTPEQAMSYTRRKVVEVRGGVSGRWYTVDCRGYLGNITYSDNGVNYRLCVHIKHSPLYPPGDHWLAQVLSLRLREPYVLRKAVRTKIK